MVSISYLSSLKQDCKVRCVRLKFIFSMNIKKKSDEWSKIEFLIFVKSHLTNHFCDRISKLNRIVNISDITIKSLRSKKDGDSGQIEASFDAVTFKFIEKAKTSGKKDKRKKRRK